MRRSWGLAGIGLLLLAAPAPAQELEAPIRLHPDRIATVFAQDCARLRQRIWAASAELPRPDERTLTTRLVPDGLVQGASFSQAVAFDAVDAGMGGRLAKLQSKLLVEVSAYDASNPENRWKGAEESERLGRGRTVDLADGRFRGDLTLAVGAQAGTAGIADVLAGSATVWNLNPIRDVSAQFDFLIRTSLERTHWGFDSLVLRVRAAYLGAFSGINSDGSSEESNESEFTVSIGFSW